MPTKKSILLIGIEPYLLHLLVMILQKNDYHVSDVASSKEVFCLLDACVFHLILLDLELPDSDGFRLLSQLHRQYPTISIVVFSNSDIPSDVQKVLRLGAAVFVSKPVYVPSLMKRIIEVLQ